MKAASIRKYLRPQKIASRRSTWNNAFASALALHDTFDVATVSDAIKDLGQDPTAALNCVYCGEAAATWDHLFKRVEKGQYSGYGHFIRNLVPCCRTCNERKGGRPWRDWMQTFEGPAAASRQKHLEEYTNKVPLQRLTIDDLFQIAPAEVKRYVEIKELIFGLLSEADSLAEAIREKAIAKQTSKD